MSESVTLTERIEADLLHLTYRPAEPDPGFPLGSHGFDVTVHGFGRQLRTPFTMGPLAGDRPEIAEVLSAMLLDSATYANVHDYSEWLSEYGMEHTPEHGRTYKAVGVQYEKLSKFFGDRFEDYLWQTENNV